MLDKGEGNPDRKAQENQISLGVMVSSPKLIE